MIRRHAGASVLAILMVLTGCANTIVGSATWPGARLEKVVLTEADFPPGVQYDRLIEDPWPARRCRRSTGDAVRAGRLLRRSDTGDLRVGQRGAGSAVEYVVAYDGARMLMTVLTWQLDLDRLAATASRCENFQAFFDPSAEGIPITTTRLDPPRADALVYQQTMRLGSTQSSVYFSFENVGTMAVFGIAFPTPNPTIAVKGTLPQTFLDVAAKQADRARSG